MNLKNDNYVIYIGTKNFTEKYYKDKDGWQKTSSTGRKFRMSAKQNIILKVIHHGKNKE